MRYRLNESDLFKRLLFLSIAERVRDEEVAADRGRLQAFMALRADAEAVNTCCAGP
jgi:hypothetical protein